MKQRRLGKTGWDVSAVSMGCWAIGGQWGAVSEQQAIRTVHAALDVGVNLFDTADSYGLGQSEILLGKALADRRDEAYVATKVGNWARRQDDPPGLKSIYSIIGCCHASLYRLGMDTIDLYQCHVGSPEHPEIFVEAFELLKQQGKIRHYAISTNNVAALQGPRRERAVRGLSDQLLDPQPYGGARHPALLPGPRHRRAAARSHRAGPADRQVRREHAVRGRRARFTWNSGAPAHQTFLSRLDVVSRLRSVLRPEQSMLEMALQFTLAHPAVTCPIPGMKSPEQARANAAAADGELDAEQLAAIASICPPEG